MSKMDVVEVDLKTFLGEKFVNRVFLVLNNEKKQIEVMGEKFEVNKYNVTSSFFLKVIIPAQISYRDYRYSDEKSLNLAKKPSIRFVLEYNKAKNLIFALEIIKCKKSAKVNIDYIVVESEKEGQYLELIEILIYSSKDSCSMVIENRYEDSFQSMRREYFEYS